MADCCLDLMEASIFTLKKTQRVRWMLNHVGEDACGPQRRRLLALEERAAEDRGGAGVGPETLR